MSTAAKDKKNVAKGFQPLGDRLFVTYTEELERTAGGIYVPDSAKEKPQRGIVQAVGKKVENVKVGDQVEIDGVGFVFELLAELPQRRVLLDGLFQLLLQIFKLDAFAFFQFRLCRLDIHHAPVIG